MIFLNNSSAGAWSGRHITFSGSISRNGANRENGESDNFLLGKSLNYDHNWRNSSRVFLQCQLWIVNHYVKSFSNNLSNENIKTVKD